MIFIARFVTIIEMKGLFRQYLLFLGIIYLTSLIFPGIVITNGVTGLLIATALVLVGFVIVKPILGIITLPLNMLTFGFFSIILTAFILFLVSLYYKSFTITPFLFPGVKIFSLTIQSFPVNLLLSYVIISATIQLLYKLAQWLFDL